MAEKIKVIVLGGCGFIGRHIVSELISSNVASYIRVVDKVPPQMAWLNKTHLKDFEDSRVAFKSANLINKGSCDAAFEGEQFDWVINAAGETKAGQEEPVYKEGILKVSLNVLNTAAVNGAKILLEISSGQMETSEKKPVGEIEECKPWTMIAKFKYEAEKEIRSQTKLNWIIVRPAIVYGPGDKTGITPRLLIGGISRYLKSEMKLLWDHKLKMNTVHVVDVARAVVFICQRGKTNQIYNLVDEAESDQGSVSKLISSLFDIEYEFYGNTLSKLAVRDATDTVQEVNEKHLEPWLKICTANSLHNTPLTPYVDVEALHDKHLNLDGSKIIKEGFGYQHPRPTSQNLVQVLNQFIEMKMLPEDFYSTDKSSNLDSC